MNIENKLDDATTATSQSLGGNRVFSNKENWKDYAGLAVVLLGILLVNMMTGARWPVVWIDEAMMSDPSVNWAGGHGFSSTAWWLQGQTDFWCGNMPLYQALLGLWIKLFGYAPIAVRSLNMVLVTISLFGVWFTLRKSRLLETPHLRTFVVGLLALTEGFTYIGRTGRYDATTLLVFTLYAFVWVGEAAPWRGWVLFLIGFISPFAGLNLVLFMATLQVLRLIFFRKILDLEAVRWGASVMAGVGALLFFNWQHGVIKPFIQYLSGYADFSGAVPVSNLAFTQKLFELDWGTKFAIGLSLLATIYARAAGLISLRSPAGFGSVAALVVPFVLWFVGKFSFHYNWMACIFSFLSLGVLIEKWLQTRDYKMAGRTVAALLVVIAIYGLPYHLFIVAMQWNSRDPARVESFVRQTIKPTDVVYADWSGFYAVHHAGCQAYFPLYFGYLDRSAEARRINVAVIRPEDKATVLPMLGGNWQLIGKMPDEPQPQNRLTSFFYHRLEKRYDLYCYHRVE
jgi:hypothetical protein